jgi:tetratricopeptide (TPR) repeat protein
MNRFLRLIPLVFPGFLLFFALPAFSQTSFEKGEALFLQNKPDEAIAFLEAAAAEDPAHAQAYLYLGIAYEQLKRFEDAIAVYLKLLPKAGDESAGVAFNLGNLYYNSGDFESALKYYSRAIEEDPGLPSAYLNRANTKIKTGAPNDAVPDYETYLKIAPESSKRGRVEQLVAFIRAEAAAGERRRLIAEEMAELARLEAERKAEEARLEAERQAELARLEAERRRKLLEEVAASLQEAADGSKGLSAGAEKVQGYEGEFELE